MRNSFAQIARDAGGPHLASLRAFTLFMPVWLFGSLLGLPHLESVQAVGFALAANGVGFAGAWLILLGLRLTLFRDRARSHVPWWNVLLGGALLGATKGLATIGSLELIWSNGSHAAILGERAVSAAIVGMWFLPSAAFVGATIERIQAAKSLAIAEELARSRLQARLPEETTKSIDALLTDALEIAIDAGRSPETRSECLRTLSHERLRPLIEQLWAESQSGAARQGPFTLRAMAAARPISPMVVSAGVFVVSIGLLVSIVGVWEGAARAGIMLILAALFSHLAKSPLVKGPWNGLALMVTCSLAYTSINELLAGALIGPFGAFSALVTGVLNGAIFFTMLAISALIILSTQEADLLRVQLDELFGRGNWTTGDLTEVKRLRQRELANLLHGEFQNSILSTELALRGSTNPGHLNEFITLIEQLRRKLLDDPAGARASSCESLESRLSTLTDRWRGIVEITSSVSEELSLSQELSDYLFHVCEEAVSNASRHGLAQRVTIELSVEGKNVHLVVRDDGVGPRAGQPGLGTFLLNSRDTTLWSLDSSKNPAGATLRLTTARR